MIRKGKSRDGRGAVTCGFSVAPGVQLATSSFTNISGSVHDIHTTHTPHLHNTYTTQTALTRHTHGTCSGSQQGCSWQPQHLHDFFCSGRVLCRTTNNLRTHWNCCHQEQNMHCDTKWEPVEILKGHRAPAGSGKLLHSPRFKINLIRGPEPTVALSHEGRMVWSPSTP